MCVWGGGGGGGEGEGCDLFFTFHDLNIFLPLSATYLRKAYVEAQPVYNM